MMATTFASNLDREFAQLTACFSPRMIVVANGQYGMFARVRGEFVRQSHRDDDEVFLVRQGRRLIRYRDRPAVAQGEVDVEARGVERVTVATEQCWVVRVEPASTEPTGASEQTVIPSIEPQLAHLRTPNLPTRQ